MIYWIWWDLGYYGEVNFTCMGKGQDVEALLGELEGPDVDR
jgi:hypothetical protein